LGNKIPSQCWYLFLNRISETWLVQNLHGREDLIWLKRVVGFFGFFYERLSHIVRVVVVTCIELHCSVTSFAKIGLILFFFVAFSCPYLDLKVQTIY